MTELEQQILFKRRDHTIIGVNFEEIEAKYMWATSLKVKEMYVKCLIKLAQDYRRFKDQVATI